MKQHCTLQNARNEITSLQILRKKNVLSVTVYSKENWIYGLLAFPNLGEKNKNRLVEIPSHIINFPLNNICLLHAVFFISTQAHLMYSAFLFNFAVFLHILVVSQRQTRGH